MLRRAAAVLCLLFLSASVPYSAIAQSLNLPSLSLGGNLETLATGSLDVTSASPLTVTITSSDPTKVLLDRISTDPGGTSQGTAQITGTIPAGKGKLGDGGFPGFWIQALVSSGTATITASAPGYQSATATVTFTHSGFVLNSPGGTGANFTATLGANSSLTVSAVQLDTAGNVLSSQQVLRGGSPLNVTVNSGTPATGTITNNPAVVQPGASSSSAVTFHPQAAGTTLLSITQPSGFSAPASGTQLTATVFAPSISLSPAVVGFNLQATGFGQLFLAPTSTLSVTITSSDASAVLLSTSPTAVGTASITVSVAAGTTALPTFYLQGLASSGTVTLTATATGYSNGFGNVALTSSAFVLMGPSGNFGDFTTTTLSPPSGLTVAIWQLDSSLRPFLPGQLRPGTSASVAVNSSNQNAGGVAGSPAVFNAGDTSNTSLSFVPQPSCTVPCTTVLSVTQPNGYLTPASGGQLTVTVNQPAVILRMNQPVIGANLQVSASGALDAASSNDVSVTITSNNPNILLSTSPTALGGPSIIVTVPAGSGVNGIGFPSYYVQALAGSGSALPNSALTRPERPRRPGSAPGSAQLTASASGYASTSFTVTIGASALALVGPNGVGGNFAVLLSQGTVNLTVQAYLLDPNTLAPNTVEAVRGGFSPSVTVTSDNPAAVFAPGNTQSTSVVISGGTTASTVTLNLQSKGTANITAVEPTGFTASGNQLAVTIN